MKTYSEIFNHYKVNGFVYQESYYTWCRESDSLKSAIKRAFLSEDQRRKVHRHQARVGRKRLAKAAEIALERFNILMRVTSITSIKFTNSFSLLALKFRFRFLGSL
jgi:hypothetical protein